MTNLLKTEFYKMIKTRYLLGITIAGVALTVIQGLLMDDKIYGVGGVSMIAYDYFVLAMIISVYIAFSNAQEFQAGTLRNVMALGYSRTKFFAAKIVANTVATTIFLLVFAIASTLTYYFVQGWGQSDGNFIIIFMQQFVLLTVLMIPFTLVFQLIAFITGNSAITIALGVGFVIASVAASGFISQIKGEIARELSLLLLPNIHIMNYQALLDIPSELSGGILMTAVYLIVIFVCGSFIFSRTDLK